jgi:hypothetical protein
VAHVYNTRHLLERFSGPPHTTPCNVCRVCLCPESQITQLRSVLCFTLCVCLLTLCAPICASTHSDRNRSSSNNTRCVCVCLLLLVGGGGPKRGPFLGTSGRTWDMKKNSWAPKLFYDNMPAHGGSTPQSAVWHDDGLIHVGPSGSKRNAPCSV